MKIGFDASQTGQGKAGCGFYAAGLLQGLAAVDHQNSYMLYKSFGGDFFDRGLIASKSALPGQNFAWGAFQRSRVEARDFWRNEGGGSEVALGSPDIIHSNNFFCPEFIDKAKLVYTLYDLSFLENHNWTTEENRVVCFNGVFNSSVYADRIVAISEYSKQRFLNFFPHFDPAKIVVIYPASRFGGDYFLRAEKPRRLQQLTENNFWLSVGTIEPRKNHPRLLQAYAQYLAEGGRAMPLVLAGGKGWLMESLTQQIREHNLGEHVILTGYVDEAELVWMYQNCFAHIYVSQYEGFGMPVLEGMSLGAATICSDNTSLPEAANGGALLTSSEDVDGIARTMLSLDAGQVDREGQKDKARQASWEFSWEKSASQLVALYESLT